MSIYITRGDSAAFSVMAENGGAPYVFQPGEVVRFKVTERKNCTNVVLQKDVAVEEETDNVIILLDKVDTKIGEVISKPVDYWYEVERNPHTDPQTIIGYDEDGAKIFKLFPEGNDELPDIDEEDIPLIDDTLSLTSERPIQNQAVSRALFGIIRAIEMDEDIPTEEYYGMKGATEDEDGSGGFVPAPKMGEQDFVLYGDGTWREPKGGGGGISQDEIQTAVNDALRIAKESGEFDGAPGAPGQPGPKGDSYTLTEADKAEIAKEAAGMVEIPEGGVTSVNGQTGDVETRLLVTITANEDGTFATNHTSQEIYAATQAGAVVEASDANGGRYSLYTCNERAAQFLTMGVRGSSGKRILYTETFVISGDKVGKGTTETPIPVAPVPMVGATDTAAGTAGLVPAPAAGDDDKFLRGDGTWREIKQGALAGKDTVAKTDLDSDVQASLNKANTALQAYTETDPTVPAWAKAQTKPTYTKSEVGLGNVDNVKQYSASNPPPYPVASVNGKTGAVALSASDVGADASGTASSSVSAHNTSNAAHSDIRALISLLSSEKVGKTSISLGIASDGLIYIFVNGNPVGTGIPQGQSGDVFGYVDENNTIVLNGNLADGTYSLKYEMENGNVVNIGNMVLDSNVYYSVTSTLTNCTINNSAKQIVEGGSYTATVTAKDGYELKSLAVTMGGSPVSVSGGSISIASVTGDIVITAVAEEKVVEVEPTNFCVPLGEGWISGGRCSSSGADREDSEAFALTNYIAVQNGDILSVQNLAVSTSTYSGLYKSDKTAVGGFTFPASGAKSGYVKDVSINGGQCQFTIDNANAGYIRICGTPSNVKNSNGSKFEDKYDVNNLGIVVNIKRNGEWL